MARPGNARGSLRVFSADCDPNESGSDEKRSGSEETPKLQNLICDAHKKSAAMAYSMWHDAKEALTLKRDSQNEQKKQIMERI